MKKINEQDGRPSRPYPYFDKSQRIKNNTPRSDESWQRIVDESIQYDKEFDKWQGSARAELQNLPKITPLESLDATMLIDFIKKEFEARTGQIFNNEGEPLLKTLIYYCFDSGLLGFNDVVFNKSTLLARTVFGKETDLKKSKGLFIIGGFGLGKTKISESINSFIFNSSTNLVTDKNGFARPLRDYTGSYQGFKLMSAHTIKKAKEAKNGLYEVALEAKNAMIDDLFAEEKSYGTECLSEYIEERYSKGLKTHIICNYQGESIEETLTAYGERYGSRLFDRAFEMFNFVEVKGKSKRK